MQSLKGDHILNSVKLTQILVPARSILRCATQDSCVQTDLGPAHVEGIEPPFDRLWHQLTLGLLCGLLSD